MFPEGLNMQKEFFEDSLVRNARIGVSEGSQRMERKAGDEDRGRGFPPALFIHVTASV